MYNTTGLAVGLAIGIPTVVFFLVIAGFWYRQKLKYKRDLERHGQEEDEDDALDLDLDHIIDTPKESHVKDFSTDDLVNRGDSDGENVDTPVVIRAGDRSFQKRSKIMGLRLMNKQEHDQLQKLPPNKRTIFGNNYSPSKLSKEQSTENYKAFYQSMIPVLPDETLNSGANSKHSSSASIGDVSHNETTNVFNAPSTPVKNSTISSQSNSDLYKLLQDDTPMNPKSRVGSTILGETPLRYSKLQSPTPSIPQETSQKSINEAAQELHNFESPMKQANHDTYISPFDTPPSNKRFQLQNMDFDSENEDETKGEIIRDDDEGVSIDQIDDTMNQSSLYSSPTKTNLHRRLNSDDSHLIIEEDHAEETYNQKRREWLNTYRKM